MFANDPSSKCRTLQTMWSESYQRSDCNQNDAVKRMATYIAQDARFNNLDPELLAERVRQCRSNGAALDLEDPRLKGQAPRTLDRSRFR